MEKETMKYPDFPGLDLVSHKTISGFEFKSENTVIFFPDKKLLTPITGKRVLHEMRRKGLDPLSASYAEELLADPTILPAELERLNLCFPGSIFRKDGKRVFVYLYSLSPGKWDWDFESFKSILSHDFVFVAREFPKNPKQAKK